MPSVCFYFQVHQPVRLKNYSFFDIGVRHDYEDEEQNRTLLRKVSERSYLPANESMLKLIKDFKGDFKISFSITGVLLDKLEEYCPEAMDSFKRLKRPTLPVYDKERYLGDLSRSSLLAVITQALDETGEVS